MADLGEQHPGSHASSLITLRSFVDVHIYVCVQSVTRGRDVSEKIGYFFFEDFLQENSAQTSFLIRENFGDDPR